MVETLRPPARATILVVDDEADNLEVISGLLKDLYKSRKAAHLERELAQSGELHELAESVHQLKRAFDASVDRS